MQPTPGDALLDLIPSSEFDELVDLYDRFAHCLDPFDPKADDAERVFVDSLQGWYDQIGGNKPSFHDFQKAIIRRCKKRIIGDTNKPPSL
jgi:hypothetical protein